MNDWSRNFNSSCLNKQSVLWQNYSRICKHIHPFILFLVGDHIKRCHKLFVDKTISLLSYLVQNADGFSSQPERKAFVLGNQDGRRYDVSWKPTISHFSVVRSVPWPLNRSEAGGDLVLLQTFLLFMCKSWYSHVTSLWTWSFTCEKQEGLWQNKVTAILASIQRPEHWAHNCKRTYWGFCSLVWAHY